MALFREHKLQIVDNNPTSYPGDLGRAVGATPFNFKVVCDCQFEALARTEEEAKSYGRGHAYRHQQADPWPEAKREVVEPESIFDPKE